MCDVTALSYGNVTLLASMSALSIIFNTVLSVVLLKENFSKSSLFSILIICIGSGLFLVNAKNEK